MSGTKVLHDTPYEIHEWLQFNINPTISEFFIHVFLRNKCSILLKNCDNYAEIRRLKTLIHRFMVKSDGLHRVASQSFNTKQYLGK